MKKEIYSLIICCFFVSCSYTETTVKNSEENFNPLKSLVQFYRGPLNHLAVVRRGECPMYPSCSQYSIQSFEKHGILIGWIMTCDRLMRCGRDETNLSQEIFVNGKSKSYDPVEKNDFWWKDECRGE